MEASSGPRLLKHPLLGWRCQSALAGEGSTSTFDAAAQLVASASERGESTSYVYPAASYLPSVTDPLGVTTPFRPDGDDDVVV